ncbi:conserved oligomeric Golgi complex subunit 7-like [Xenia sp. Carnegie-2017]|uniref:conserved oligomeric Golgi complex subunit 7-like n=1 Tax=Xenia sp. Carnegie-2017 TaxID=2897299 RepID=UPI001F04D81D|nr:conserved oligomeric Golgi complex subunit 7-like [Xenia sp. Carnegie-2017]
MDFSKFSDDNFEAKQWVNAALKRKDEKTELDAHASGLVMKLQLFIQEVNKTLEETSTQSLNNMPRVLREIEVIRQEATLLKEQMGLVKDDIKAVEQNTSESMKMLLDLDEVKSRIQSASHALQEADNWTMLSADLDKVFKSGNYKEISEKLVGMHRSLVVLRDVPDFDERHKLLEGLKNKLEALLSPKLVSAFNSHSLDESREYFQIFSDIDRLDQLQNYYVRCHKSKLLQLWKDVQDEDPNKTMLDWLSVFYNSLLSTWHSELMWCSQVFGNPDAVLCLLLTQTLSHLDPPFSVCLRDYVQNHKYPLQELIDLKQVTLRFSKSLQSSFNDLKEDDFKRAEALVNAVCSPYTPYLLDYCALQTGFLKENLISVPLDTDGFLETVDVLSESVGKIFHFTENAVDICFSFTDGLGSFQLMLSIEVFFALYLENIEAAVNKIRGNLNLDEQSETDVKEDWQSFQYSSKLIQICGDLLIRIQDLQASLSKRVVNSCQKWLKKKKNPEKKTVADIFNMHNYLEKENRLEFESLMEFIDSVMNGSNILNEVVKRIEDINNSVHTLAFEVAFLPLKSKINTVSSLQVWCKTKSDLGDSLSDDIPEFSLSPQGYITEVGDYLLTLPHQLELFMIQDNPALVAALNVGKLKFSRDINADQDPASRWLSCIANATMHTYIESILCIPELTEFASKQLVADIEYLFNILEALEVKPSEVLTNINKLLKSEQEEFHILAADLCVEDRVKNALIGMRNK